MVMLYDYDRNSEYNGVMMIVMIEASVVLPMIFDLS